MLAIRSDIYLIGEPVASTLDDGRRVLEVVLAAAASTRRGQAVAVRDAPPAMTLPAGEDRSASDTP